MTESRAFATMVASPSQKGGLTSVPATSNPTFSFSSSSSSLNSRSTLKQLWSSIPFLPASPSSPSSSLSSGRSTHVHPIADTASSYPSCSTRTCLSYCCTPPDLTTPCPQSRRTPTFNLRPKNYYSKRQRFMSSGPRQSSASSASHSESGSDRDEQNDSATQRHLHVHNRSSHGTGTNSTTTVTTTTTTTTTIESLAISAPSTVSSVEEAMTLPSNKTRLPAFSLMMDGPYLFVFDVALSLYYPIRAMILFVLGFVFSLIIDHLQTQHHLVEYPSNTPHLWDTASWLPPTCGASAVLIGTIYPLGDYLWWGKRVRRNGRDWSGVMRCLGGFIGVNYAASKLPWTSSLQVSSTLALISLALWFLFDRTFPGFVISLTVASMGTVVAYFLVLNGWYSFTKADFFGVGSWIPCILYSSSVCFGSIGRQLDVVPETWYHSNGTGHVHLKSE